MSMVQINFLRFIISNCVLEINENENCDLLKILDDLSDWCVEFLRKFLDIIGTID